MALGARVLAMCLCLAGAEAAYGVQPADPASSIAAARGEDYVAARAAALELPGPEFSQVLADLRASASYGDHLVADALEMRRSNPALVASFDALVKHAWDTATKDRRGDKRPALAGAAIDPAMRPLAMEHLLRRTDLQAELRWIFIEFMPKGDEVTPENVEVLLAMMEIAEEGRFGMLCIAAGRWANATGDTRILPAIVAAYDRHRERFPDAYLSAPGVMAGFISLGTPEAVEAARAIVASERARMEAAGFAP